MFALSAEIAKNYVASVSACFDDNFSCILIWETKITRGMTSLFSKLDVQ